MVKRCYESDVKTGTKTVEIYECPDCGFEFNSIHEVDEQVGGWECPLCEVEEKQKEIERLESFIETLQIVSFTELQREKATVERYEKALEWYANERNYIRSEEEYFEGYPPEIMNDRGYKARKILKD